MNKDAQLDRLEEQDRVVYQVQAVCEVASSRDQVAGLGTKSHGEKRVSLHAQNTPGLRLQAASNDWHQ